MTLGERVPWERGCLVSCFISSTVLTSPKRTLESFKSTGSLPHVVASKFYAYPIEVCPATTSNRFQGICLHYINLELEYRIEFQLVIATIHF